MSSLPLFCSDESILPIFNSGSLGIDSYNETVSMQHCMINLLVNYLPLEALKKIHLVDKRSNFYASNSDFYCFFVKSYNSENSNFYSWRQVFFYYMTHYDSRLKMTFGYKFGFPSDLFSQSRQIDNRVIKNNFKRRYYSDIPSQYHLYRIISLEDLKKTVFDVDSEFINKADIFYAGINQYVNTHYTNALSSEKLQLAQNIMSLVFDYRFTNIISKKNELSKNRYYMSLVLTLPELISDCNSFAKSYWYHILLRLPPFYRDAGFVLLYEQLRKNVAFGKSDSIDCQYVDLIFLTFQNEYKQTNKFTIFSLPFFAHFAIDKLHDNFMNDEMRNYCLNIFNSNDAHYMTKYMLSRFLTEHFFKLPEGTSVTSEIFEAFDKYALYGLETTLKYNYHVWFRYFRKILWLRYCLNTMQNVNLKHLIDTNFINDVLDHVTQNYKNTYWTIWQFCMSKYAIKSE